MSTAPKSLLVDSQAGVRVKLVREQAVSLVIYSIVALTVRNDFLSDEETSAHPSEENHYKSAIVNILFGWI